MMFLGTTEISTLQSQEYTLSSLRNIHSLVLGIYTLLSYNIHSSVLGIYTLLSQEYTLSSLRNIHNSVLGIYTLLSWNLDSLVLGKYILQKETIYPYSTYLVCTLCIYLCVQYIIYKLICGLRRRVNIKRVWLLMVLSQTSTTYSQHALHQGSVLISKLPHPADLSLQESAVIEQLIGTQLRMAHYYREAAKKTFQTFQCSLSYSLFDSGLITAKELLFVNFFIRTEDALFVKLARTIDKI